MELPIPTVAVERQHRFQVHWSIFSPSDCEENLTQNLGPDVVHVRVLRATPPSPSRQARGRGQPGARWGPGDRLLQGAAYCPGFPLKRAGSSSRQGRERAVEVGPSGEGGKGGCLEGSESAGPPTRLSRAPPAEGPPTRRPGKLRAASAPGRPGQPTRGLQRETFREPRPPSDRREAPAAETPPRPELPPQLPGPGEPQVRSPAPRGRGGDGAGPPGQPRPSALGSRPAIPPS